MKIFRKILMILGILIGFVVLVIAGYVIYMQANYYRIEDNLEIEPENNQTESVQLDTEYSISTYNIGFGAYSQDYSFFMDSGVMLDGTKIHGKYGKGRSKSETTANTNGDISILKEWMPDFMLWQEVDTKGTRSYNVNQKQMICDAFSSYSSSYALNYHTTYIMLPLNDPMGTATSGILSLSRFKMESSIRRSLPISQSFITKFTDLDRCINVVRYKVSDKELVVINVHLSAYDSGGVYRKKQVALLNEILSAERELGNYVIVGGDFNQDIASTIGKFPTTQQDPSWVAVLEESELTEGYSFAADGETWGSCRAAELPYTEGVNYVVTVDGFIVSDNITVSSVKNYNNSFLYSDHLPVLMKFKLNS